jgi:hypothetical protein
MLLNKLPLIIDVEKPAGMTDRPEVQVNFQANARFLKLAK